MKFSFLHFLIFVSFLFVQITASAQCDGRYVDPIFSNVDVTYDIVFGENINDNGTTKILHADIYEPQGDTETSRPVIVLMHGGTFIGGDKNAPDIVDICMRFAKRGYVCASIQYRLMDASNPLAMLALADVNEMAIVVGRTVMDAKAAVRFLRKDAATDNEYGIDPDIIFIGGASAGAISALHYAYIDDTLELEPGIRTALLSLSGDLEGDSGNPGYSSEVNGVINLCGALLEADYIGEDDQPLFSAHGTADATIPYGTGQIYGGVVPIPLPVVNGSETLRNKCDTMDIFNHLYTIPGGDHMAHAMGSDVDSTDRRLANFLYALLPCNPHNVLNITALEEEIENKHSFTIFPNPVQDQFVLKLKSKNRNSDFSVIISDNLGRTVANLKGDGSEQFLIERNELPSGIYHLTVRFENELPVSKRVVFN